MTITVDERKFEAVDSDLFEENLSYLTHD